MHHTPITPNAFPMSDQGGGFPQPSPFGGPGMPPPPPAGDRPPRSLRQEVSPARPRARTPGPYPAASRLPAAGPTPAGRGGGNFGSGGKQGGGGGGRTALILIGILAVTGLSTAAWLITRNDAQNQVEDAQDQVDDILATIPEITIPEITIPVVTLPEGLDTVPVVTLPPAAETTAPVETVPVETAPVETAPPVVVPEVNLFTGTQAGDMVAAIAAARGASPLRILTIAIYPTYSFAQVQDPTIPANVDEFPWRDGSVGASSPVQLIGEGDLEANLFSDTEINWAAIPGLIEASAAALAIEGGEVTHVIVERNLPFSADVVIRVYVNGPRNSGFVEADAQGNITAVRPQLSRSADGHHIWPARSWPRRSGKSPRRSRAATVDRIASAGTGRLMR